MSSISTRIDICVATYHRPAALATLLESVRGQRLRPGMAVTLIVVDNDANGSARETVEQFKRTANISVIFDVEPIKNIALARNRGVSHCQGQYAAFLDDDEYAVEFWLQSLLDTAEQVKADAVVGPIISVLPDDAPRWITAGGFFDRPRYATGTPVESSGMGNALLRTAILRSVDGPFDRRYGLTGGEDANFFAAIRSRGAKIVWCDTALAYEPIPTERLTLKWIAMRAFRSGQVQADLTLRGRSKPYKYAWLAYRALHLLVNLAGICILGLISRTWAAVALVKAFRNIGRLSIISDYRYKEYADR